MTACHRAQSSLLSSLHRHSPLMISSSLLQLNTIHIVTVPKLISPRPLSWTPDPCIYYPPDLPTSLSKTHLKLYMLNSTFLIFQNCTSNGFLCLSWWQFCPSSQAIKHEYPLWLFLLFSISNLSVKTIIFTIRIYLESACFHLLYFCHLSQCHSHLLTRWPKVS